MADETEVQIRSFRVVFDLERRIHRIDKIRIPLPYGLPLRSVAYACTALATVVALAQLPLVGAVVGVLPAPIRFVALPGGVAYGLTQVRVDGRPAHTAAIALVR